MDEWIMITMSNEWTGVIFFTFLLFKNIAFLMQEMKWLESFGNQSKTRSFSIHLSVPFFNFIFGYCITFVLIFHSLYIPLWSWISSTLILVSLIVMPPMIQLQLNVLKPLLGIISLSFPLIAHSFFLLTFFFRLVNYARIQLVSKPRLHPSSILVRGGSVIWVTVYSHKFYHHFLQNKPSWHFH